MPSEVVIGQGAKPGGGGMLLGMKITERVAAMRRLPVGIDQRSACRHPDWTGPDDLTIKIQEIREITNWEKPIYVKVGATRTRYDVALAVKAGADVVVVDGMQGGTAATQDVFNEHVGIPTLPAVRLAVEALQELDMHRKVQLIVSGGIRSGADAGKALALGADAVSIGSAAMVALGCNKPVHVEDYSQARCTEPGFCHHCHTGLCSGRRHDPDPGTAKPAPTRTARAGSGTTFRLHGPWNSRPWQGPAARTTCTIWSRKTSSRLPWKAAAMAGVPLAGTNWIPGRNNY